MRFDKEKAFELRRAGKSYKAIKADLGMSLATLSDWFKNENWSKEIKTKLASIASAKNAEKLALMQRARQTNISNLYGRAHLEAAREYAIHSRTPLFIAGLMIYWGEGDKRSKYRCSVANTEPRLINIFTRFLTEICGIDKEKVKVWILLYPDLDEDKCKDFWMRASGLKESNFSNSATIQGKSAVRRLTHGVCNVGLHNRYFKEKMLTWLELAAKELAGEVENAGMV